VGVLCLDDHAKVFGHLGVHGVLGPLAVLDPHLLPDGVARLDEQDLRWLGVGFRESPPEFLSVPLEVNAVALPAHPETQLLCIFGEVEVRHLFDQTPGRLDLVGCLM